jgi:hypothetical protein
VLGPYTFVYRNRTNKKWPGCLILKGPEGDGQSESGGEGEVTIPNPLATTLHTTIMLHPEGEVRQEFIKKLYLTHSKKES